MSSLLIRCITAAVAVPLLLVIIILLPQMNHLAFSIVIVLVNAIGTFELHNNILRKKIDVPFTGYLAILLPIVELINSYTIKDDELTIFLLLCFLGFAFFVEVIHGAKDNFSHSLERIGATALTLCYPSAIIVFLAIVFGSDTAAYFTGMLFGKNNKGYVKCSPNKSIAGFIGGTIGISLILSILVAIFPSMLPLTPPSMFLLALCTAIFGTFGDLFESMLKRSAGVKDSGIAVPGRGGMLDCIDSISVAIPIYVLLLQMMVL